MRVQGAKVRLVEWVVREFERSTEVRELVLEVRKE